MMIRDGAVWTSGLSDFRTAAFKLICACLMTVSLHGAELKVVASLPFIADLAKHVAGEHAQVESLAPGGVNLHIWQPIPSDAQKLTGARLVLAHGLGLDSWLAAMVTASGYKGSVVEVAALVQPLTCSTHAHADGTAHVHRVDPHAFHDVRNAVIYVKAIRDALVAIDPAKAIIFQARADLVLAQLSVLDAWVRRQVAKIPAARRVLVTSHEGLGYYAAAYGFTVHAAEGVAHGQEASPRQVTELVSVVRQLGLRSLFSESGQADGVLRAVAQATGAAVAGPLAGDGTLAGQTYGEMIVANTLMIVEGLR
mgnify:CR=1 FL=1